jgi:hypothetical protein
MAFDSTTATNLAQQLGISTGAALIIFNEGASSNALQNAQQILGSIGPGNAPPLSFGAVASYITANNIPL